MLWIVDNITYNEETFFLLSLKNDLNLHHQLDLQLDLTMILILITIMNHEPQKKVHHLILNVSVVNFLMLSSKVSILICILYFRSILMYDIFFN